MPLHVAAHPLCQHLVTRLRETDTAPDEFRSLTRHLTVLLALEATANLALASYSIETPLETMEGKRLAQGLAVVPILRAGLGMLEAFVDFFPDVLVGHIGLARDHDTAIAASYYSKLPAPALLRDRITLIVDPMLATGGSACQAIDLVKNAGAGDVRLVCVVAAPEGVAAVEARHPGIHIITAALDRELNDKKYILPGLGDFGDRLYGTN